VSVVESAKRFANETRFQTAHPIVPMTAKLWENLDALLVPSTIIRLPVTPIKICHRIRFPLISSRLHFPDKTVQFLALIILLAGDPYHEIIMITETLFFAYSSRIYKSRRSTSQNV